MKSESDKSDEELVLMSLQERAFFSLLVGRYEEPLRMYLWRLGVHDQDDREDLLQEIFIKSYRGLNGFDTSLKFSSWMYRIAHNETISFFRKKKVRPEGHLIDDSESLIALIASEEWRKDFVFDEERNSTVVQEALNALDIKYREVIVLRFFEHKEYDEISDILKIPKGSVGTLLHRAKKHMRKKINPHKITL